ncbi:MAG TPA: hypothetical protein VLE21_03505 [Candidatus Nitrosocosmicus sp.]|nr:hypothetical protein [Candidatus Nitrosocosmicus sp.]
MERISGEYVVFTKLDNIMKEIMIMVSMCSLFRRLWRIPKDITEGQRIRKQST